MLHKSKYLRISCCIWIQISLQIPRKLRLLILVLPPAQTEIFILQVKHSSALYWILENLYQNTTGCLKNMTNLFFCNFQTNLGGRRGGGWFGYAAWTLSMFARQWDARFVKVYRSHKLCRNIHSHNSCGNARGISPFYRDCGNALGNFSLKYKNVKS